MRRSQLFAGSLVVSILSACSQSVPSLPPPPQPTYVPGPMATDTANELSAFQGARAGQAENGLRTLGYEPVRSMGLTTYWYNAGSGACAEIVTADGRYSSVKMVSATNCLTTAQTVAPAPTPSPASDAGSPAAATIPSTPATTTANTGVRTGSAADENACLLAVAKKARSSVSVLSSELSQGATLVMVGVGTNNAPWRCLVSGGKVQETSPA